MKKKLEAELISIAHRILKLKNKSELIQLHQESQKLYEKLSVLLFVEENFTGSQPTIGRSEAYEILETAFDNDEVPGKVEMDVQEEIALEAEKTIEEAPKEEVQEEETREEETPEEEKTTAEEIKEAEEEVANEPESEQEKVVVGEIELSDEELEEEEPVEQEDEEETVIEEPEEVEEEEKVAEEVKEELIEEPAFELAFDKKEDVEEVAKESGHQIIFEDFLGSDYKDLEFVKAEIEEKHKHDHDEEPVVEETKEEAKEEEKEEVIEVVKADEPEKVEETIEETPKPAIEKVTKGITIGLNDRVGFVNHLFGGSNEDFNRVLSQLNTFDTFQDAQNFIEDLVKPDYNEWKGKEDYAERFLEVVENKFK